MMSVTAYMPTSQYDQRFPPWLLKHGANSNLPDYVGTSPMFYVAGYGSLTTLRLLFDYGAKVESNALFAIIRKKKNDNPKQILMVQLLLSKGADINILRKRERRPSSNALTHSRMFRYTSVWEAVKAKDVEMVEFLIRNGADVNLRILVNDIEKSSPLEEMLASHYVELR
jgi:ankyrin repeat protein